MRSQPKKPAKARKPKKAKKPSNPFSPNLTDAERARRLNGRRVVQLKRDGSKVRYDSVRFHKYLPRGDVTDGGHRDKNLIQFYTDAGKHTLEVREISKLK